MKGIAHDEQLFP